MCFPVGMQGVQLVLPPHTVINCTCGDDLYLVATSQNADRSAKNCIRGEATASAKGEDPSLSPLIPAGSVWLRLEKLFFLGQEHAMIQGLYGFGKTSSIQKQMKELVGQDMCCASTIPCLCATDVFW